MKIAKGFQDPHCLRSLYCALVRSILEFAVVVWCPYQSTFIWYGIRARSFSWTNSTTVKCWLSSPPSRWKQFVANRVSEIQHITKDSVWNHVAGLQNPADIISRGMAPIQLQYRSLWFSGPHWLRSDECNWLSTPLISEDEFDPIDLEVRDVSAVLPVIEPSDVFSLRSSLSNLQRHAAWILRFRIKSQTELADLTTSRRVRESSKILALNSQLEEGVLCVGEQFRPASIKNRRSTLQKVQRHVQQLLKNWSKLYLSELHNRTKWTVHRNNVAVGTMVVLKDEERPPLKWQLGRVTDVHAGEDGNVRVVTVKTKDGSYRRAVSKICVLPIRDNIVSSNGEN
ncbi:uncharacterized protein LOC134285311 [Aedes albopictus]|uniref:DUF5641 domain-containing protein n=1 Tax=Aedes albopictus TaxID=7160 RepID=A0ABM1Z2J9_AEDAL